MPELSPGALFIATSAAPDRRHHRYRCPLDVDDDDNHFAASSTTVTFPAAGASATSSAVDRLAFSVYGRDRLIDASAVADRKNDGAEEPSDDGWPSVFRETLRGGAHGARLPVHILLHALPEFADRQVHIETRIFFNSYIIPRPRIICSENILLYSCKYVS